MPQYKLGRWDGKVAFLVSAVQDMLIVLMLLQMCYTSLNVEIVDIEDRRETVDLKFDPNCSDYWG